MLKCTPIGVEKYGQLKAVMGCSTGQHMPHLKAFITRLAATACRGVRIPRRGVIRIMEMAGERIGGDHLPQQGSGSGMHLRTGAGRTTDNLRSGKVAKGRVVWPRDSGHRLKRRKNNMAEGGRRERQVKEGERRSTREEQEQIAEETENSGEKEMGIGKEECQARVTFEVGQSSRSNNRGRPSKRGKGRRRRGRGRSWQPDQCEKETPVVNQQKRGRRSIEQVTQEAERAYVKGTNEDIRRIIDALENRVLEEPSNLELEEWNTLLPDPGNTRGHLTLYKQALHMYWVMKHLLARAMEQVAIEMTEIVQSLSDMKKEMTNLQFMIRKQDNKIEEICGMLKEITKAKREDEIKKEIMVD